LKIKAQAQADGRWQMADGRWQRAEEVIIFIARFVLKPDMNDYLENRDWGST